MTRNSEGMNAVDKEYLMNAPLEELLKKARILRQQWFNNELDVCSIMNAKSGACSEDCAFCAQSARHATGIQIYPLKSLDDMVSAAAAAREIGAKRFGIVCSGNRPTEREVERLCQAIRIISERCDISVCASLGKLSYEEFVQLRQAGLSRYHHNIETSRRFYSCIVTTHCFEDRIATIMDANRAGLEVCSGVIIGMGETREDRIDMALELDRLPVVSVPINILVPIKGTRLERCERIPAVECIRCIAIFRILLKNRVIKIAAGRETVLKDFQAMGFSAGANGMLIGGYLTVKGRDLEADRQLIEDITRMWESGL